MSASENKRSIIVGIFVLLGIIIFVAGALVLGGQQKRFSRTLQIMAIFDDVGGLKAGNNVWFSGVKIGTVKRVRFYGNAQVEVDMNIETSAKEYIRKDASATISSDGLIGNKIVVIVGGTTAHPPIEEGDRLKTLPALSSDELLETLQENNQNLLKVTNDVKDLLGNIKRGRGTIGAVLTDSVLANNFRSTVKNLQQASVNASAVSGSLAQFSTKLNRPGGLANDLVTDTTVMRRLRGTAARLEQVSTTAGRAVENVERTSANLERTSTKLNSNTSAIGVLLNDPETGANLKATMRNLNTGSQLLNEDLKAVQSNFLFRGYFRRQERERKKAAEQQPADTTAAGNR